MLVQSHAANGAAAEGEEAHDDHEHEHEDSEEVRHQLHWRRSGSSASLRAVARQQVAVHGFGSCRSSKLLMQQVQGIGVHAVNMQQMDLLDYGHIDGEQNAEIHRWLVCSTVGTTLIV